jgi:hypothetical protein
MRVEARYRDDEVEVNGVTIRAGHGADANMIAAIVPALKAGR